MLKCPLNPPILGEFEFRFPLKLAGDESDRSLREGVPLELGGRNSTVSKKSNLTAFDHVRVQNLEGSLANISNHPMTCGNCCKLFLLILTDQQPAIAQNTAVLICIEYIHCRGFPVVRPYSFTSLN